MTVCTAGIEYTLGLATLQQPIRGFIVERKILRIDPFTGGLFNQIDSDSQNRKVSQPEKIHLQEPGRFNIVHRPLGDNVVFHGFLEEDEKNDYLASADVVSYPATGGEAFGIVLIEAMSTGQCVVLGGDNSGYRTVLGEGPNLLFDPLNPSCNKL